MAFSRLWAPRSRISAAASSGSPRHASASSTSSRSEPGGPKVTRRARPPGAMSGGTTATSSSRLAGEDPQLRVAVALEGPVAVEVVLLEVEEQRGVRGERARVLQLEARDLAHHRGARVERAHERRPAACPRSRPPPPRARRRRRRRRAARRWWSCRWCPSRPGSGSAAGARPARARRARAARAPAPRAITGASRGTPGLLTTQRHAVEQLHAVGAQVRLDARRRLGPPAVAGDHLAVGAGASPRPRARTWPGPPPGTAPAAVGAAPALTRLTGSTAGRG